MTLLAIATFGLAPGCQRSGAPATEIDSSFELIDESGKRVTSGDFDGRIRLVFFGYTSCPDMCPITLANVAAALRSLDSLAEQITVLFISIDPKRDTPEILAQYTDLFHPAVLGLTGTYDQLVEVTAGYRTTFGYKVSSDGVERSLSKEEYESVSPKASYVPFHSSQLYVIGRDNELLDIIGYGSKPEFIAAKLHDYIAG